MSHRDGTPLPGALSGDVIERVIRLDSALIYLVNGALSYLCDREGFEQTGTLTTDAAKAALSDMLWVYLTEEVVPTIYPVDFSISGLLLEQVAGTADHAGGAQPGSAYGNTRVSANPANFDEYAFRCLLAAGTYIFWLNYYRNTDCGKLDVTVNGDALITQLDMHGSLLLVNAAYSLVCPQNGLYTVNLRVNGKNASSSNYRFRVGGIHIYQTLAGGA